MSPTTPSTSGDALPPRPMRKQPTVVLKNTPVANFGTNMMEMQLDATPNVSVKNRYGVLGSFTSNVATRASAKNIANTTSSVPGNSPPGTSQTADGLAAAKSPIKPPPLYVQHFDGDILKLSASLKADYGEGFKLKYLGGRVRIQLVKIDDFMDLKNKLFSGNRAFHTFTLNAQKAMVVALKGLPKIPTETILDDIKNQGLKPVSCTPLISEGKRKSPYCSYKVVFPQGTTFNSICKLSYVFYTRVYWEKFLSLKPYTPA